MAAKKTKPDIKGFIEAHAKQNSPVNLQEVVKIITKPLSERGFELISANLVRKDKQLNISIVRCIPTHRLPTRR